jgi:hypothetical protein
MYVIVHDFTWNHGASKLYFGNVSGPPPARKLTELEIATSLFLNLTHFFRCVKGRGFAFIGRYLVRGGWKQLQWHHKKAWVFQSFTIIVLWLKHFSGIYVLSLSNMTRANVRDSCAACTSCNDLHLSATTMKPLAPTWQMVPVHFIRQTDQTEKLL